MNVNRIPSSSAVRRAVAACAVALLGASALAQPAEDAPPPPAQAAPGGAPGEGHPRFEPRRIAAHVHQRQAELKARLAITPQQEAAWNAWTEAGRPPRGEAPPDFRAERAALARLATPERIDRLRALRSQRDLRARQRDQATLALYASLAPAQQKVFDAETLPGPGPHHGPRRQDGERPAQRPVPPAAPAAAP